MSSTERVRKWRAEQRRKAQLYDQLEAARIARLKRAATYLVPIEKGSDAVDRVLAAAIADPLCLDLFDKA